MNADKKSTNKNLVPSCYQGEMMTRNNVSKGREEAVGPTLYEHTFAMFLKLASRPRLKLSED